MDFLDPRKRQTHRIRLMVGYVLIALAIGLGTVILVYDAYGYGINAKTGDIIQNGLVFLDSRPGGAQIYLDGKKQNATTSSRLILPARDYSLVLKKTGYRDWTRKFTLNEHTIARYVYPFLFPSQPKPQSVKKYSSAPGLITGTPDRKKLLVQSPRISPGAFIFDEFNAGNLKQPAKALSLTESLLIGADKTGGGLVEMEWSTDNRHVLLRHDYDGGNEFLIFDSVEPAKSINLNRLFGAVPSQVALRNKKSDQVYIYNQSGGTVQVGDTTNGRLAQPFLRQVLAFKAYGSSLLTYITSESAPEGQVIARIWDNGKTYQLNQFTAGSVYLIDAAQFQGHWYYVAGSNTAERVNVYKDPLDRLKDSSLKKAVPISTLRLAGGEKVSFSTNARFIGLEAGQKFAVYDIEGQTGYSYGLPNPLGGLMHWMDGHRWIGVSGGNVLVTDYDGTNQQILIPTTSASGGFFDRDYEQLLTIASTEGSGAFELQSTDLRAGSDLSN